MYIDKFLLRYIPKRTTLLYISKLLIRNMFGNLSKRALTIYYYSCSKYNIDIVKYNVTNIYYKTYQIIPFQKII